VLTPDGIAFAPTPMLVETDKDKYTIQRIVNFYYSQPTDFRRIIFRLHGATSIGFALGQAHRDAGEDCRRFEGKPESIFRWSGGILGEAPAVAKNEVGTDPEAADDVQCVARSWGRIRPNRLARNSPRCATGWFVSGKTRRCSMRPPVVKGLPGGSEALMELEAARCMPTIGRDSDPRASAQR